MNSMRLENAHGRTRWRHETYLPSGIRFSRQITPGVIARHVVITQTAADGRFEFAAGAAVTFEGGPDAQVREMTAAAKSNRSCHSMHATAAPGRQSLRNQCREQQDRAHGRAGEHILSPSLT